MASIRNLALKLPLNFLGLVLLCHALSVVARSVQRPRLDDKDPMMALPSGRSERSQQEVKYVAYQPASPYTMAAQAAEPGRQPQLLADYQESQPEQQYEMVQVQPGVSEQAEDCNQRQEFTALLDQRPESAAGANGGEQSISPEYAGQLVYVSQGNEAERFKNTAASWSQASDVSATILTEIPVKDMPAEVLRKLKRDFGVKVVATRDRPGANLVINCDEYSGQENSICSHHLASHEAAYQAQPSKRPQVETMVPIVMPPRQGATSFHHAEHVVQPTSEPNHVYVPESPTESYQTDEDSRGATEQSHPSQEGEQAGYEVATPATSQTSAYEAEQQQADNKETPLSSHPANQHQSGEGHGDEQEEPASYEQTGRSAPGRGQESREQSGGFDQQQHNDHEAHWRQNSASEQTVRRASSADWQAPSHDYVKQVDSSETNSAADAHQTSR